MFGRAGTNLGRDLFMHVLGRAGAGAGGAGGARREGCPLPTFLKLTSRDYVTNPSTLKQKTERVREREAREERAAKAAHHREAICNTYRAFLVQIVGHAGTNLGRDLFRAGAGAGGERGARGQSCPRSRGEARARGTEIGSARTGPLAPGGDWIRFVTIPVFCR